jgi:hypothetical protein
MTTPSRTRGPRRAERDRQNRSIHNGVEVGSVLPADPEVPSDTPDKSYPLRPNRFVGTDRDDPHRDAAGQDRVGTNPCARAESWTAPPPRHERGWQQPRTVVCSASPLLAAHSRTGSVSAKMPVATRKRERRGSQLSKLLTSTSPPPSASCSCSAWLRQSPPCRSKQKEAGRSRAVLGPVVGGAVTRSLAAASIFRAMGDESDTPSARVRQVFALVDPQSSWLAEAKRRGLARSWGPSATPET